MSVVEFEGSPDEAMAAEDWCGRFTEGRWAMEQVGDDSYEFAFQSRFDANDFRQRHKANTSFVR
jgi:hypothetical protein